VSAQNRKRLYWTNIPDITQPHNKNLFLKDIIQSDVDERYFIGDNHAGHIKSLNQKAGCLTGGAHSGGNHSDMTLLYRLPHGYIKETIKEYNKYPALAAQYPSTKYNLIQNKAETFTIRRLTEIECERLQTVPDNYTEGVSNTQRYKMLGNGWTVDVIAHILCNIS
jgi:DNA (cytosine-5)-methyltransferase 3A